MLVPSPISINPGYIEDKTVENHTLALSAIKIFPLITESGATNAFLLIIALPNWYPIQGSIPNSAIGSSPDSSALKMLLFD